MKLAGCTVHFVTEGMDEGPVIAQAVVPVLIDDTAETLAARVLTVEHQTYATALKLVASGGVSMRPDGGVERIASETDATAKLISA
jgi:phosphoribosylglycinamide formyltransferase 1